MKDESYKSSPFYQGHDGLVSRLESAMSWDEAAKSLQHNQGSNDQPYRGISENDTQVTQAISRATFSDENSSAYRTQLRIQDALKLQSQQLNDEVKRQKIYAEQLRETLEDGDQ